MTTKTVTLFIALTFFCAMPLFLTSCAKQQLKTEEEVVKSGEETAAGEGEVTEDYDRGASERERERAERERERALQDAISAFSAEKIYFEFDRSELQPEARAVLKKKADWLSDNADFSLRIEGHCDERGTNEYNLALGERRANAARDFLMALGISGDRITTVSYGEERPADRGHSEEAWAKNRRDEFELLK